MKIALIGNYPPDRQESMLRYADMLRDALLEAGYQVSLTLPPSVLNRGRRSARGAWRWVGYADKYWLGRRELQRAADGADVVHICDHSNAIYVPRSGIVPYVVTCHDLLAVRGALGEDTDCPASLLGRRLQYAILAGLRRARALACVSEATLRDARRLLGDRPRLMMLKSSALNYPFRPLPEPEWRRRLVPFPGVGARPYVLHVGSNLRRKNRELVVRAVADAAHEWHGDAVFAGQPLDAQSRALGARLGLADRLLDVDKPSGSQLEALYNGALALIFPSRFEGFGWPIIEAQACGCPVICSDREPLPEVAGTGAIVLDAEDTLGFGRAIRQLAASSELRLDLRRRGLENAARYDRSQMIGRLTALYAQVTARSQMAGHA